MKTKPWMLVPALMLISQLAVAAVEPESADDVLVVRYACLIGAREIGTAPTSGGILSRDELRQFLLSWQPGSDNAEVREIFALNELGELARQAGQLPLSGGQVSGVYHHGEASFEIDLTVHPANTSPPDENMMVVTAEIKRNTTLLAGPTVLTPLDNRVILSAKNGPEAPFLFLVVEVDRISAPELRKRGLRYSWRKDYRLVDGEDVTQPVVIEKTVPKYTTAAKEARQQGMVILRLVIDEEGTVEDVEVVEGQPYGLTEQAVKAARTWRYLPATHKGKPVPVFYFVTINFRLE